MQHQSCGCSLLLDRRVHRPLAVPDGQTSWRQAGSAIGAVSVRRRVRPVTRIDCVAREGERFGAEPAEPARCAGNHNDAVTH
jgi:hypothetical protein